MRIRGIHILLKGQHLCSFCGAVHYRNIVLFRIMFMAKCAIVCSTDVVPLMMVGTEKVGASDFFSK